MPADLELDFKRELIAFEEQSNMPYITSIERLGRQEGHAQGLQEGLATMLIGRLSIKFVSLDEAQRQRIQAAFADTLLQWSTRILSAETLDDIFATDSAADVLRRAMAAGGPGSPASNTG